jgi:hypothetical protein
VETFFANSSSTLVSPCSRHVCILVFRSNMLDFLLTFWIYLFLFAATFIDEMEIYFNVRNGKIFTSLILTRFVHGVWEQTIQTGRASVYVRKWPLETVDALSSDDLIRLFTVVKYSAAEHKIGYYDSVFHMYWVLSVDNSVGFQRTRG